MKEIAITLEGVLRKPLDVGAQDFGATLLYLALAEHFRITILGTDDVEKDNHFLTVNGFVKHAGIEPERPSDSPIPSLRWQAQVNRLRAAGHFFEFVVVPDPGMARYLYKVGVPSLLYLHPEYSSESFRPDYSGGTRPWGELQAMVDYTRQARATEIKKREEEADA